MTLNARVETVDDKPSFRDVVSQRCLVIANGFYEWQWLDSKGTNKVKYKIGIDNEELFVFAGLFRIGQITKLAKSKTPTLFLLQWPTH
jgi:putative SOS response-associated peptidase YedK